MRVDADGRVEDAGKPACEFERVLRGGDVPTRDADALDPHLDGAGDHIVAIGVESAVLQVGVRIDEAGQSLGNSATAQAGTSSSSRGKIGMAVPVVH